MDEVVLHVKTEKFHKNYNQAVNLVKYLESNSMQKNQMHYYTLNMKNLKGH